MSKTVSDLPIHSCRFMLAPQLARAGRASPGMVQHVRSRALVRIGKDLLPDKDRTGEQWSGRGHHTGTCDDWQSVGSASIDRALGFQLSTGVLDYDTMQVDGVRVRDLRGDTPPNVASGSDADGSGQRVRCVAFFGSEIARRDCAAVARWRQDHYLRQALTHRVSHVHLLRGAYAQCLELGQPW